MDASLIVQTYGLQKKILNNNVFGVFNHVYKFISIVELDYLYIVHYIYMEEEKEECQSSFKVGVNKMPVRPIHADVSRTHVTSAPGLLTSLRVDSMVVTMSPNQH